MSQIERGAERTAAFERAFVAMRYFLGHRGEDLAQPLEPAHAKAREVAGLLADPDRQHRAEALAHELGHVARALEARTLR